MPPKNLVLKATEHNTPTTVVVFYRGERACSEFNLNVSLPVGISKLY